MKPSLEKSNSKAASAVRSGVRSVAHSISTGGVWLRKSIWIWPVIAAVLLGLIGWFVRGAVEDRIRQDRAEVLQTILKADVAALRQWMTAQEANAQALVREPHRVALIVELLALAERPETTSGTLLDSKASKDLREGLAGPLESQHYSGYVLVNPQLKIVASKRDKLVGDNVTEDDRPYVTRVLTGESTVSAPRPSTVPLPTPSGEEKIGVPTMLAWAPVKNADGKVIAAFGARIEPERDFSKILQVGRVGTTGETYAFNRAGKMVSQSRFEDQLRDLGMLREGESSVMTIEVRDPGADLAKGERSPLRASERPLTYPVTTKEKADIDPTVYRDYRGSPSVGASTWLPEYEMGIITEQDAADAFAVLGPVRWMFWGLFGLLAAGSLAIFIFSVKVAKLQREARRLAIEGKQLGQYTLEEKLGEGGMGIVYRAHHSMLHRPTAVKFLSADKTNEQTVARFEREVQLTSQLSHPNTIAIYDYGRTPENIFYYAMEYLEGINLQDMVQQFGPLNEARTIHILRQICGSLDEAHSIGLIHRDIKPANIFVTVRGGLHDFSKLLDFGLVKAVDQRKESQLTTMGSVAGTPLYLSPEAIGGGDQVDARADLYAVGAVGYYLLTGTNVFEGAQVIEILQKHIGQTPQPMSERLGRPVAHDLEVVIQQCLKKNPKERPPTAGVLAALLDACEAAGKWTQDDAKKWWTSNFGNRGKTVATTQAAPAPVDQTVVHVPSQDTAS